MLTLLSKIVKKLGVDGAIAYTILGRAIQAIGGVISILFIARYLSKVEQGYYYTFGSILAIQIFFELGLSSIITQFVAHEVAHLRWISDATLEGNTEALSRLSSLLRFCAKWFAVIASLLIVVLIITGYIFFNKYSKGDISVKWDVPWIILSIATACSLTVSPILAFLEGLNKVRDVARIRLIQQVMQLSILYILLVSGLKLYASPLAAAFAFIVVPLSIFFSYKRRLLQFIWHQLGESRVNYKLEIFPFQWRIALSWISGYFMYQLFNPVIFATEGPVVAGQMGMTLAALNGVMAVALSWINTKVPLFSSLIAKQEYNNLDAIFSKTIKQSSIICAGCLIVLIVVVFILQYQHINIGSRFLPILPLIFLCASAFVNQLVAGLATYLRCHKKEPFLLFSIVMALLTTLSTFSLGGLYGLMGIVSGYTVLTVFVSLFWGIQIFRTKKFEWHQVVS